MAQISGIAFSSCWLLCGMPSILFARLVDAEVQATHVARLRRQRGGWRQKQNILDADPATAEVASIGQLGPGMLLDFCDGWLSAYRLCLHSSRAMHDGNRCRLVRALGVIGASQHSNKLVVELLQSLALLNIITTIRGSTWTHFIKPTDLVKMMKANYPLEFKKRVGADEILVTSFWRMFYSSPVRVRWAKDHPDLQHVTTHTELARVIPIAIHQDAYLYLSEG